MEYGLFWTLIVLQIVGLMLSAYMIGRKREPVTGGQFAVKLIISAAIIVALFVWGNPQ